MIGFKSFIIESLDIEKLKHLEHLEDHIIHGGHEGVKHASMTLSDVIDALQGKKSSTKITTKYDGAPSIVFGINPENGKFFVASKSAFNKNPKLNYTDKDIEENHGHAPGLVAKLKAALQELPKIMPKSGGVFQGDLMYTPEDISEKDGSVSFTPNVLTYTADKDSAHGREIAASKLGIVVHSQYTGKNLAEAKVSFDVDHSKFKRDPDVHMINPEVEPGDIAPIERKQYEKEIKAATELYTSMGHDIFNVVDGHDDKMKMYINQCVRDDTTPNLKDYRKFVEGRFNKEIEKLKSEAGKAKKKEAMDVMMSHIDNHTEQLGGIFKLHNHLQKAKNALVNALARTDTGFKTSIGGKETKPEGFVAIRNGRPTKLIDRAEFSRANFADGRFQGQSDSDQKVPEEASNPIVFSFGRLNPPGIGHQVMIDKGAELAKEKKAKQKVVMSRSQDPEKNPLSPEQKLKHAKRMFPDTDIVVADESEPTVIQQVKKLFKAGYDELHMVVGSDRVEEMKKLLDQYNGKEYAFKRIVVHSAGARDPDSEDELQAASGTGQRGHAVNNRFKEFARGVPKHVHPEHAKELFTDVRQGMDIKIGPETPNRVLANHARRNDPIGVRARKEQERRLKAAEEEKKQKQAAKLSKKKPVKEETSGASVGGLGFVSGTPAVDTPGVQNYVDANTVDSDQKDNILKSWIKSNHTKLHNNKLGFKSFDPKDKKI